MAFYYCQSGENGQDNQCDHAVHFGEYPRGKSGGICACFTGTDNVIVFCFMGLIGSEVSVLQGRSSVPPPSLWSVRIVFYRKVVGAKSPIIDNGCLGQEMTESDWCLSGYFILGRSDWCWCPYSSVFFSSLPNGK